MTQTAIIEAAFLAGYEPSADNMTDEAMAVEATQFLALSMLY